MLYQGSKKTADLAKLLGGLVGRNDLDEVTYE